MAGLASPMPTSFEGGRLKCTDERVREINRALLLGRTSRAVAEKFGVGIWVLRKHRQRCLPYRKARAPKPTTVQEKLAALSREMWRLQILAECGEQVGGALAVVRQRQSLLEPEARMSGLLDATHKKLIMSNRAPEGDFAVEFGCAPMPLWTGLSQTASRPRVIKPSPSVG